MTEFGRDIRCVRDADELFTEAEGLDVAYQDAVHRITTENVLGDDGTGSLMINGWGFDVRRLLGLPTSKLAPYQPVISEVLQRDPRVTAADVTLVRTTTNGLEDVRIEARCQTAEGPFNIIKSVLDLTAGDLRGRP